MKHKGHTKLYARQILSQVSKLLHVQEDAEIAPMFIAPNLIDHIHHTQAILCIRKITWCCWLVVLEAYARFHSGIASPRNK